MALVIVKADGSEDYTTLAAAISAGETEIEIQGTWASAETSNFSIPAGNTKIEATGDAKHPGYVGASPTHWRARNTSGHTLQCSVDTELIGLDLGNQSTGTSDEVCRIQISNRTIKFNACLLWFSARNDEQDLVYIQASGTTLEFLNCVGWNAYRAVVDGYNIGGTTAVKINSSHFYNCGYSFGTTTRSGIVGVRPQSSGTLNVHVFNSLLHVNSGYPFTTDGVGTANVTIDRCITNDDTWTNGLWDSNTETDSPDEYTWADTDQGAGNYVIVNDLPDDLSLTDLGNTKNKAQDAHTDSSGANLTMPSVDIVGTSRPQDTDYDCGAFEIVSGGSILPIKLSVHNSQQKWRA